MRCPFCKAAVSKVVDKRTVESVGEIRRRRECLKCSKRFTTYERIADLELSVIKRDGRREPFLREKLRLGIAKALEKRPIIGRIDEITDKIERKLRRRGEREVASKLIGQSVLTELKKVDSVAYVRFASVYRHFDEASDFAKELKHLNLEKFEST